MKKICLFSLLATALLCVSCDKPNKNIVNKIKDYSIIPKPVKLTMQKGRFVVKDNTTISVEKELENESNFLVQMIKEVSGKTIKTTTNKGNIYLRLNPTISNEESYSLMVDFDKVVISGGSAKGVFYGLQSLQQLLQKDADGKVTIPAVEIHDAPRFAYRGVHLDVGRHFFSADYIKKYIDIIAMHKMNTFHWHLTEDQGWRIEIKKYPKLTEVGGYRNGTIVGRYPGTTNDEKVHGGFYTQEQIKDVIRYAEERHITIIPEIELPGHSQAAIAAYPFLSCFPNKPTEVRNNMMSKKSRELQKKGVNKVVQENWGVYPDVFVPTEETFKFLEDVLSEVIALFPSKYIHIGGDECPKDNWKQSEFCQNLIKKLNLKNEHELQSYFIQRIEKFLNTKGRQIIGWDEILEGGLAPNATVMSWRGEKGGIEAAKQHHDVIMTPNTYLYFDYYQSKPVENEPLAIGGYLPVEKVYEYEPIPKEISAEDVKHILGAQANLWTEYIETSDKLEYMLLPRMTALSEVVWSPKASKNWEDFKKRFQHMATIYDRKDINYAKHLIEDTE